MEVNYIIKSLRKERCILVLGPEIKPVTNQPSVKSKLINYLKEEDDNFFYYKKDGLFIFDPPETKNDICYTIEDYFREDYDPTIYEQIAQLPFHLIVNLSPDHYLSQSFTKQDFPHVFDFYKKNHKPKELKKPTTSMPLVYNLFGSYLDAESLILTHEDVFDFFVSVMSNKKMPQTMQDEIKSTHKIVFMGFNLDQSFMQFMFRIFNMHDDKYAVKQYFVNENKHEKLEHLYDRQFRMKFIHQSDSDFINKLFNASSEAGILRMNSKSSLTVSDRIIEYVEENEIEKAIELMKSFFAKRNDTMMDNDLSMLKSQLNSLKRRIARGVIDEKEEQLMSARIKQAILDYNNELKELEQDGHSIDI